MMPSRSMNPLCLGMALILASPVAQAQTPESLAARVDTVFAEHNRTDAPGCVCAVMQNGAIVHEKGYGMANLELDVPLTHNSVFYIASTSKQFTAASIALLSLRGELDLDADIHTYLPEMGDLGHRVTVRHLVHHTSGIRDYFGLLSLTGWTDRDYLNNDRAYELLTRQRALNFEPGSQYLYSNSNYVLMAEIVQRMSGKTLRRFAEENIFSPLGMADTHFDDDHFQIVKHRTTSYGRAGGGGYERYPKAFDAVGDGNLLTTVRDLWKWDSNFYEPLVGGQEFLALMLSRGRLNDGEELDYAFGLAHGRYRGLATVSHGGAFKGFRTQLLRFPDQHFSVAVLCNVATANPTALANGVADIFLADQLEPATAADAPRALPTIHLSDAELEPFIGHYWSANSSLARRIELRDGKLVYHRGSGDETTLAPLSGDRFVMLDVAANVVVTFERGSPTTMTVVVNDGAPSVFESYEPVTLVGQDLEPYVGAFWSDELLAEVRVTASDSGLALHVKHQQPLQLRPIFRHLFRGAGPTVTFLRSGGQITGLEIDDGRIRHVRFERKPM